MVVFSCREEGIKQYNKGVDMFVTVPVPLCYREGVYVYVYDSEYGCVVMVRTLGDGRGYYI